MFVIVVALVATMTSLGQQHATAAGRTTLVSVNTSGTSANNASSFTFGGGMSADGTKVVFNSFATDLVAADTDPGQDVYLRNTTAGTTTLVSISADGTSGADGASYPIAITPDGTKVLFEGDASNLSTPAPSGLYENVYVRDLTAGTTTLVTVNSAGTSGGNDDSFAIGFSDDGTKVLFESYANNFGPTDTNQEQFRTSQLDAYVRDLTADTTSLVSVNAGGTDSGNGYTTPLAITPDGTKVVFNSQSSDIAPVDSNGAAADAFLRNLTTGTTTVLSENADGTDTGSSESYARAVTPDGSKVVLNSSAGDLESEEASDGTSQVFVRNVGAASTVLVSAGTSGARANGSSDGIAISDDGTKVGFSSGANDIASGDDNGGQDAFIRNLTSGTTTLVSTTGSGSGDGASEALKMTPNGRYMLFSSIADDLVASSVSGEQFYLRDTQSSSTTLVTHSADFESGADQSLGGHPQITSDGSRIAYWSFATNLVPDDTNNKADVFLTDLVNPTGDTDPPQTTIDSGNYGDSNETTRTFTFSSDEANSTFECRLGTSPNAGSFSSCSSPKSYSSLVVGTTYYFAVRATDATNNTDPTPAKTFFKVLATTADNFANAKVLSGDNASDSDNNANGTREPNEPDHNDSSSGRSYWYRWTSTSAANVSVDTCTASFDTVLAVYTGSSVGNLTKVGSNDDTFNCPNSLHSVVNFTSQASTTYAIAVDSSFNTPGGAYTLHLMATAIPPDTSAPDTFIDVGPQGGTNAFFFHSSEVGSTFECRIDSLQETDFNTCSSPAVYKDLVAGSHTFEVRASDAVPNTDTSPASSTFVVPERGPGLKISDVTQSETDGNTTFVFTVTLDKKAKKTVKFTYQTQDTTTAGGTDYGAVTNKVKIKKGKISATISITVFGDNDVEPDEYFVVHLSDAKGAVIGDADGVGTIQNDDT